MKNFLVRFFPFLITLSLLLVACTGPYPTGMPTPGQSQNAQAPAAVQTKPAPAGGKPTQSTDYSLKETLVDPPALTGKVLYHAYIGGKYQIFMINLASGEITQLTKDGENIEARWSSDGSRIAYACNLSGQNYQLCTMNADGSNQAQVTTNAFLDFSPDWSPDGKFLVFVSNEQPQAHIYTLNLQTGERKRLVNKEGNESAPRWSPDGSKILYMADRGGLWNLYTIHPDGTNEEQVTESGKDDRPAWSSDGKKIAFRRQVLFFPNFSGQEVLIADADGQNPVQLTFNDRLDSWPAFSPDGKWVVYTTDSSNDSYLLVVPTAGGSPAPLYKGGVLGRGPDWIP
jgi:TolB protein